MIHTDLSKPLFTLTIGEWFELQKNERLINSSQQTPPKEKTTIKGIHALAKFLQVSPVTAQKIKNSGKIPYSQYGRVILFDGDAVLLAMAAIGKPKKR